MIDREPINVAAGVGFYPFKNVSKLRFPQDLTLAYEPPLHALATSPLLKYGQSEGFIEAIAVEENDDQESPFKSVRFTSTFKDGQWVITEAPIIFVARFILASLADYHDLINYSAKVVLRRKSYYLDLIDPIDCDTDEEIKEFIDETELLSFNLHTANSRPRAFEEMVVPGRARLLRSIRFDFVKNEGVETSGEQPRLFL